MKAIAASELELFAFFGIEPERVDADQPWFYNTLTYSVVSGGAGVRFELSPAYRDVKLIVQIAGRVTYELAATQVDDVIVHSKGQREALEIRFDEGNQLWLVLRPLVSLFHQAEARP